MTGEKHWRDLECETCKAVQQLVFEYGGIDGGYHKQWVLDQIIRKIYGDDYDKWVQSYMAGEDGPGTYEWNEGVVP